MKEIIYLHNVDDFVTFYIKDILYEGKIIQRNFNVLDEIPMYVVRYREPGRRNYIGSVELREDECW